jgi:peptide-methionine (R)-S-oxide reductase
MNRRHFLQAMIGVMGLTVLPAIVRSQTPPTKEKDIVPLVLTDTEWKKRLTHQQYRVLREGKTEKPFSSPLNSEKREGIYACAGCELPLFTSKQKFDSFTGWPSFYAALLGHVARVSTYEAMIPHLEYHCARCGGHQGHVFDDGPEPTGLRYCNNGVALTFIPS